MRDYLKKIIAEKEAKVNDLRSKANESESIDEVRSIGAEIDTLNIEISEARKMLERIENEDRSAMNPLATYGEGRATANDGDMEYRKAFMDFVINGKAIPEELRETTMTTDVVSAIPTVLVNRIVEKMQASGMILNRVTRVAFPAGIVVPTTSVRPVATWVAEGAGSDVQKLATGKIVFSYFKLRCEVAITAEVNAMTLSAFEDLLVDQVAKAMVIAIEEAIIAGDGDGKPTGILSAASADIPADRQIKTTGKDGAWTYADLVAADSAVPAEYEDSAVWFMTKKQFGAVLGMVDGNGQPVARVNYGIAGRPERYLMGREVVIHPYATQMGPAIAAIFDFGDYVLNTIYDMGIQRKQDWDDEDYHTKAVMSVDGKPVSTESLVVVTAGN